MYYLIDGCFRNTIDVCEFLIKEDGVYAVLDGKKYIVKSSHTFVEDEQIIYPFRIWFNNKYFLVAKAVTLDYLNSVSSYRFRQIFAEEYPSLNYDACVTKCKFLDKSEDLELCLTAYGVLTKFYVVGSRILYSSELDYKVFMPLERSDFYILKYYEKCRRYLDNNFYLGNGKLVKLEMR